MSEPPELITPLITPNDEHQQPHISISIDNNNTDTDEQEEEGPYEFLGVESYRIPSKTTTADPFRNHTPKIQGLYEWLKIIIITPVALLRLALFGLSLVFGYLFTKIALYGWRDKHSPLPVWRSRLMWLTRISARCILFSFGYQWIRRKGRPAPRDVAPIVVSNHVSYIDPIFFFYELFPTIVASESHDSLPFVGTIIRAMQVIYVNRFSPASRKNAVNEIKGTTSNGRFMLSFQMGAFIPGYPIQPVVVRYPYAHFDQSWGNISLMKLMFRMFTQFHNFMEVEYLPVVSPLQSQKESVSQFAERTARSIATALNVVQTSYSYGDMLLLVKAHESKQENPSSFMIEMAHEDLDYRINTMVALEFLEKFLSMNPDKSGCVKFEDFLGALKLKPCDLSRKVFEFVDIEKRGKVTFKQFLLASTQIMKQPLFQRACEYSFEVCNPYGQDHVFYKEFGDAVKTATSSSSDGDVKELFKMFDVDGDGKISKHDFLSCLRRNPLLIALFSALLPDHFSHISSGLLEEIV